MGCAGSKQASRDRHARSPSPYNRSKSMPIHHVSNSRRHMVSLTSSTFNSLKLDEYELVNEDDKIMMKIDNDTKEKGQSWSDMIETKIPKTFVQTDTIETKIPKTFVESDTNELEVINAWELMEGLEEAVAETVLSVSVSESIVSDFDPEIISNFRKALDQLSPQHRFLLRSPVSGNAALEKTDTQPEPSVPVSEPTETDIPTSVSEETAIGPKTPVPVSETSPKTPVPVSETNTPKYTGLVKARITAFQEKINAKRAKKRPPNGDRKVVYYFTSLRGVRRTYEDCCNIRTILQGYGVKIDERDVSMHAGFKEEIATLLGTGIVLPRVFVNGEYVGGAEEVRRMHEDGKLGKVLEECDTVGKWGGHACNACGDMRFVPCEECSGSCKVYVETEEDDGDVVGGFRRCEECNENGLVRCPVCC